MRCVVAAAPRPHAANAARTASSAPAGSRYCATVESAIFNLLADGYNAGGWNGSGIMSSSAGGGGLFALGYGESADLLDMSAGETETWRGQAVDATSILIRFTYAGDATLDGFISGDDYSAIDFASGTPGADGWSNGDFNYDGLISGDDYAIIDFNLVAQGPPLGAGATGGIAAVPEPASSVACALALVAAAARRRSRSLVSSK